MTWLRGKIETPALFFYYDAKRPWNREQGTGNSFTMREFQDLEMSTAKSCTAIENPEFYEPSEVGVGNNEKLTKIVESQSSKFFKLLKKLPLDFTNGGQFLKLFLMKPIDVEDQMNIVR